MAITISGSGIVEANLADNAVTLAKMASGTDGEILTYDASGNPTSVSVGTDGQVLTSTGVGSPPAFEAAAGLPSGGSVGQVVVNTGSGTGSWAVLEDGSYPSNFVQQQGYSYKVTGYSSTTSSSQVDAVDFGTVGTVQKGSMVTVTMNLPSCYSNVDGYGGTYYLDIRDDADPTNYYLNHIYHARSISSTAHRPAGSLQGVLRMKAGSGTTTFSVKMTVTCDYSPYPAMWNAVSRNAASLIWTERN
jgi:hypothetical protein